MEEVAIVKNPEDGLTKLEKEELTKWRRGADTTPLSSLVAVNLYPMFLLGHTCEDIARSSGKFSLGLVLDARIRHKWDERRDAYLEQLYSEANNTVRQRMTEGALFVSDVLAAAHVEFGAKFRKFLQTKDPKDLDEKFKITSITTYKMVVDALRAITGLDRKTGETGPLVQINASTAQVGEGQQQALASGDAHDLLKLLDAADKVVEGKRL